MGRKKKYIEMFGSFTEPFYSHLPMICPDSSLFAKLHLWYETPTFM